MTVTLIEAIEQLEKAVELKGHDYIYQRSRWGSCSNFRDGRPSCLVGHVWYNLGFGPDWFDEHGLGDKHSVVSVFDAGLDIEPAAYTVLVIAQHLQDMGVRWGSAVEIAVEYGSGVTSFEEADTAINFVISQATNWIDLVEVLNARSE